MEPYPLQFLLTVIALFVFNRSELGLRYFCLFCLPFYSMPLFKLSFGSTFIRPFQIMLLVCIVWMLMNSKPILKKVSTRAALMLLPFALSLLYNVFFFTPIEVWVINDRIGYNYTELVNRLNLSSFTQFIYLVFGAIAMIVFGSLSLDAEKLKKAIEFSMYAVSFAGLMQVLAHYTDLNWLFRSVFSVLDNDMADQGFLWGLKRVSSTFAEPSYFGQYAFYTLLFYLVCFGYQNFKQSKAVYALFFVAVISTSTSSYWGLMVLLVIMFLFYSSANEKMAYYIMFMVFGLPVMYLLSGYVNEYWLSKEASSNMRTKVSWDLPMSQIMVSPFWGFGFGTSKPTFIYTQLLHSIGIVGSLMFAFFTCMSLRKNIPAVLYLIGVVCFGIGNFELALSELWVYFGLLLNPYLRSQLASVRTLSGQSRVSRNLLRNKHDGPGYVTNG